MLISKFDLYKPEWLELVFDNRNKTYGAYELRQHNGRTMLTAMVITFTIIAVPMIIVGVLIRTVAPAIPHDRMIPIPLINVVQPPAVHPPRNVVHQTHTVTPPAALTTPRVFVPLVVSPNPTTIEPPRVNNIPGDVTSTTTPGPISGSGINDGTPGPPSTTAPGNGDVAVPPVGLERMPEPYGGAGAWSKFLGKNLKYPEQAIDQHMQGRVWVSFIVEKDGHLSNIVVERGAGYGMDEEALRVLKLSPAWKPGIQNGQPVRVKYNIPINFQMSDDD